MFTKYSESRRSSAKTQSTAKRSEHGLKDVSWKGSVGTNEISEIATEDISDEDDITFEESDEDDIDAKSESSAMERFRAVVFKYLPKPPKLHTIKELQVVLETYVDYLSKKRQFDDLASCQILESINDMHAEYKTWETVVSELLLKLKYTKPFKKVLQKGEDGGVFKTDKTWASVMNTLNILKNYSDSSPEFADALVHQGFIKYYADNLRKEPYLENQSNKHVNQILTTSLRTVNNCVKHIPVSKVYEKEHLKETLRPYLTNDNKVMKTIAIMAMSSLATEEESAQMENTGSIPFMVDCLHKTLSSPGHTYEGFSSLELLETLTRLAVNEDNKMKLVDAGILPCIVMVLQGSDEEEHESAAKLIWTLSFDVNVRKKLIEEEGYMEALQKLTDCSNDTVKEMAKGALWKIKGAEERDTFGRQESADEDKHIFISYSRKNAKVVYKVKDKLKADGFNIWIDTEQMAGSTLESMAEAVEDAKVVLICVSEAYKCSPSCRTEAEYTFQLKRPIIPLMLQRHYHADGWLGMLMGSKLYINFDGKYEFSYAYQMLLRELKESMENASEEASDAWDGGGGNTGSHQAAAAPVLHQQASLQAAPSAAKWDKKQVMEWVVQNGFDKFSKQLQNLFFTMDGNLLLKFCAMKKEAPDFFYNQLMKEYHLNMQKILLLIAAMEALEKTV